MQRAFLVLYLAAFIDATGVGLIIPILPTVLRHLVGAGPITLHYGFLIAAFALMQFLCAPALGLLSDRFGRRPVLLISLLGGALDYLITGFAPTLLVLYAGRMIGGITAANLSVISATIADLAPDADRARRFGAMSAALGIGWVAGPAIGGMLGQINTTLPFLLAAAMNGRNLLLALAILPETRRPDPATRTPLRLARLNAFAAFRVLGTLPALVPLLAIFAALNLLGQIPASLWILYGQFRYGWSMAIVGWSFASFGLLFAAAQAFLTAPATRRLGARPCLMLGMALDAIATAVMGLGGRPWVPFAIIPLFAAGGVGMPALQDAMSRAVGPDRQGELQGALASLTSLAGVAGPLLATACFAATSDTVPGAAWFAGAAGYLACIGLAARQGRRAGLKTSLA